MASVGYILDTNVVIQLFRGGSLGRYIDQSYGLRSGLSRCIISVVTVGECLAFARKVKTPWSDKRVVRLEDLLSEIVWVDIKEWPILRAYAEIDVASNAQGRAMAKNDVWIAAAARLPGATLLTMDKDFDHLDGTLINRIWIDPKMG